MRKYQRELRKVLKRYGYRIVGRSSNGHITAINRKTGHTITMSNSPKNQDYTIRNVEADILKYGR